MASRNTWNYTYRVGRRVSHRGVVNNPARREHYRARPGGKLTVDSRDKTRSSALNADGVRIKIRGYHA